MHLFAPNAAQDLAVKISPVVIPQITVAISYVHACWQVPQCRRIQQPNLCVLPTFVPVEPHTFTHARGHVPFWWVGRRVMLRHIMTRGPPEIAREVWAAMRSIIQFQNTLREVERRGYLNDNEALEEKSDEYLQWRVSKGRGCTTKDHSILLRKPTYEHSAA
jgi:hypothetical protein